MQNTGKSKTKRTPGRVKSKVPSRKKQPLEKQQPSPLTAPAPESTQAEEEVKLSEARYRSLVETQADVISRSDLQQNLIFVNDSYCRTFGIPREQALGKHFKSTVYPEDLPVVTGMLDAIKRPPYRKYIEIRNLTPGGVRWFGWENSAVRNDQGSIVELQGVGRDITERRQAEEALRQSEEKFRKAFIISPDSININRLQDGMYIAINNGFTQIMGYGEAECLGKTSVELNIWVDPEVRKKLVDGLTTTGEVTNLEARFRAKN
jgi:PAS domain S-box-containing protein